MNTKQQTLLRRDFLGHGGKLALSALALNAPGATANAASGKVRLAMVGTGSRGTGTWGPPLRLLSRPEVTVITLRPPRRRRSSSSPPSPSSTNVAGSGTWPGGP